MHRRRSARAAAVLVQARLLLRAFDPRACPPVRPTGRPLSCPRATPRSAATSLVRQRRASVRLSLHTPPRLLRLPHPRSRLATCRCPRDRASVAEPPPARSCPRPLALPTKSPFAPQITTVASHRQASERSNPWPFPRTHHQLPVPTEPPLPRRLVPRQRCTSPLPAPACTQSWPDAHCSLVGTHRRRHSRPPLAIAPP